MKIQGTVSLTLIPRKITEQIVLSVITWHIQDKGTGTSQPVFMKVRSYLTNLICFYDK